MKSTLKLKWENPNYFSLKDALIKSGSAYFPGVEGAKCVVTQFYTGTIPTGYTAVPVTNTVFKYTGGAGGCGNVQTNTDSIICANFEGTDPCFFMVNINYDISVNVCSTCF